MPVQWPFMHTKTVQSRANSSACSGKTSEGGFALGLRGSSFLLTHKKIYIYSHIFLLYCSNSSCLRFMVGQLTKCTIHLFKYRPKHVRMFPQKVVCITLWQSSCFCVTDALCRGAVQGHREGMGTPCVHWSVIRSGASHFWQSWRPYSRSEENLHAGQEMIVESLNPLSQTWTFCWNLNHHSLIGDCISFGGMFIYFFFTFQISILPCMKMLYSSLMWVRRSSWRECSRRRTHGISLACLHVTLKCTPIFSIRITLCSLVAMHFHFCLHFYSLGT